MTGGESRAAGAQRVAFEAVAVEVVPDSAPTVLGDEAEPSRRLIADRRGRPRRPRLLVGLSYYAPYTSGLTDVARRINDDLQDRGWDVTVVTTRFDDAQARHAVVGKVGVRRSRRLLTIGRAPVSPSFPIALARDMRQADLTLLHLPLPEAGLIASVAPRDRLITMYHCDPGALRVPGEETVGRLLDASHRRAIESSSATFVTSLDYAQHSRLSEALLQHPVVVPPPCIARPTGVASLRETAGPHVGFLGRVVPEKGLDYLVAAFRRIEDPDARLLICGEFDEVAGGGALRAVSEAAAGDPRIRLLGFLEESRISDFYASIDVLALPSVDSFEAFGIVQVEALMAGVPVVVSDLPGVRTVASSVGAGFVVPPRDVSRLHEGLVAALDSTLDRETVRANAIAAYGIEAVGARVDEFLWRKVLENGAQQVTVAPKATAPRSIEAGTALNAQFDDDPEGYERQRQVWLFERRVRHVLEFLAPARPGDVVLEVGCGTGLLLRRLAHERPDLRFRGVEPLSSYVEYSNERVAEAGLVECRVQQGFAENLATLSLEAADWVLSNDVLHHVDDLELTVKSVAEVTRPWARWLAIEPNPTNPWVIWYHNRTPGEQVFPTRRFVDAAKRNGWTIRDREHLFLVPQAVVRPPRLLRAAERAFERLPVISGGLAMVLEHQGRDSHAP
jgi:glycosyltransferase involved in cell wall biosynthesis/ubiquinone/menaquinone biosynthesis C-methylase UbiE